MINALVAQQTQAKNTLSQVKENVPIPSAVSPVPKPPKAAPPIPLLPGFWAPFYSIGNAFEEMPSK